MQSATKLSPVVVAYGMDALQLTNLALKGAHSTLKFNQDGEDLAKKCDQIVVRKKPKNATKNKPMLEEAKWSMEWAKMCS